MMRESHSSHRSADAGGGLWVQVNLPIFKHKKSKDVVTYCSWQWDVAIFHQSGWDDQHLLPYIFHSLQGFLGDLASSLGKDATLSDVLQMLDENYSVVMTFDVLSKEIYSLKQGLSENVAVFWVYLLQQVQILKSEYPGRIQPEHMEEMKCYHFCEGLYPEYWKMLAHKVDGEHPASYSNLLLATQSLERWSEAGDPLPPKMAATSGSNMIHSQMPGNLFLSHKLRGNHTFTAQAVTIGNDKAEEDSSVNRKEKERWSLQLMKE